MTDRLDEHLLQAALAPAAWSVFDPEWYARAYPGAGETGFDALRSHYLTTGQAAGLSPVRWFDEAWYRTTYPDITTAIAAGTWRSGFEQYCLEGHADRSPGPLFDDEFYAAQNPALTDDALRDAGCFNRYDHFLKIGAGTGRTGHPLFDAAAYAETAAVLPGDAFGHYLDAVRFDPAEPKPSWYFDPVWYRGTYPAARAAIARGQFASALHHYLGNDTPTEFDPLPDFSEAHYLAKTPQASLTVQAGIFRNGYAHFLTHPTGSPAPWIDLAYYAARYPMAAANPFRHLLATGLATGLRTSPESAASAAGLLPLLARGRIDFMLSNPAALTAIVLAPPERAEALGALGALQGARPGAVELFLLDWTGEAAGLAKLAAGARLLGFTPGRRGAACNAALAASAGGAVLLLDGAAIPTPAGLAAGLRRLAEDPAIGIVGGPLIGADGKLIEAGASVAADGAMHSTLHGAPAQLAEAGFVREVDGFRSTQVLIRRSLLDALGGFAENLPDHQVIMDLCLRAWQSGYRVIYDPAMAVAVQGARRQRVSGLPTAASPGFVALHAPYLYRPRTPQMARAVRTGVRCVLVVAPKLPEDNDIVFNRIATLVADGSEVTLFPLDGGPADPAVLPSYLPDSVEIVCGHGEAGLPAFLAARGEVFFNEIVTV